MTDPTPNEPSRGPREGPHYNIRRRLIVSFATVFVLALLLVQTVDIWGLPFSNRPGRQRRQAGEAFRELNVVADVKKEQLLEWLEERRRDARAMVENDLVKEHAARLVADAHAHPGNQQDTATLKAMLARSPSHAVLTSYLEGVQDIHAAYRDLEIADAQTGRILAGTKEENVGLDISATPLFRGVLLTRTDFVGDILPHEGNPPRRFHIGRAIRDKNGQVIGVLSTEMDPDSLLRSLYPVPGTQGMGQSGHLLLANQAGAILASYDSPENPEKAAGPLLDRSEIRIVDIARGGMEGMVEGRDELGRPVLAVYRHVRISPDWGWGLVVTRSKDELFAPLRRELVWSFWIGLAGSILVVAATILLSRNLSQPIRELTAAARRVTEGDLDARAAIISDDEVGYLARTFNAMVERVRESYGELESRVGARTAELNEKNKELEREIHERGKVEEALKESEERTRAIMAAMGDGLCIVDTNFLVTYGNQIYKDLFGETTGKRCYEIVTRTPDVCENCPVVKTFQDGGIHTGEVVAETLKGRRILEITSSPFRDSAGHIAAGIKVVRDVTNRKEVEEKRKQLEARLQNAQKVESLGVLAGGVAHDFNNLLQGILGNAELALLRLPPQEPARNMIREIEMAAGRAADLARQMLAYSGRGAFVVRSVDLSGTVCEMTNLLASAVSKKVVLEHQLAPHLPPVHADATQIQQVVMNLVTNASEALGTSGGTIAVRTGAMEADRSYLRDAHGYEDGAEGTYIYLEVSDTGCGMDAETTAKIFDPFFTTKFLGRGLGLASVHGIVRGHRGAIKVSSSPGRGTTFRVLFPAARPPAADGPKTPKDARVEPEDTAARGTILVVDDEEMVRSVAEEALASVGFTVLTANDGKEAVEVFRDHAESIRAVLLDLTMPVMDGEEALRELRRIQPAVRVILSSGYSETETVHRFEGQGIAGFIQKPYQIMDLIKKVQSLLKG